MSWAFARAEKVRRVERIAVLIIFSLAEAEE